ncbi:MAG: IS66 family transposase [Bacillota bacterium]
MYEKDLRAENAQLKQQLTEAEQQLTEALKRIAQLEKQNKKLRGQLRKFINENTPSGSLPPYLKDELKQMTTEEHKEIEEESIKSAKFNPRNRRKKYGRKELHTLEKCPCCNSPLTERKRRLRRTVLHLKLPEVENVLHESKTYYCEKCKKEIAAPIPDTVPKSKIDLNISLLIILLYSVGTTQRKIAEFLRWFGVFLSNASINNTIHRMQRYLGDKKYKELEEQLKKSISSGADETGHRYRGKTYYTWAVANAKTVFYRIEKDRRHYRAKKLPIGKIIICDGWRAYDTLKKKIQRCWAHLLRKARTLEFPFDSEEQIQQYKEFVEGLTKIYREAKAEGQRNKQLKELYDKKLKEFVLKPRKQEDNLLKVLNYILEYEGEWFTFLEVKGVEPTNNRCERALRPMVIRRKISEHNWSLKGLHGLEVMQSLYETCKLRNKDFMNLVRNEVEANTHESGNS